MRRSPLRILLVINALPAGGAERVLSLLANAWAARGDAVVVATFTRPGDPSFFFLDPAIERRFMGLSGEPGPALSLLGAFGRNLSRMRAIRRAIRAARPDVVMSFMNVTNVLTILTAKGTGVPVIATEHIDPSQEDIGPLWTALRRWVYPHAALLAVLAERVLEYFPEDIRRRSVVVPNPVLEAADPSPVPMHEGGHTLLAMGRMTPQKGFDLLLEAFARVADRHPSWTLEIRGDGPLRDDLVEQARALGLAQRVRFPGRTNDAYATLRSSDLYVLSSRYEGFPMVLCEAMANGLPVVSFDCRTGPREIVRDGIDGILVPAGDVGALAEALDRLFADPALRQRLAARAPEITRRFGITAVLAHWDEVFATLSRGGARSGRIGPSGGDGVPRDPGGGVGGDIMGGTS